MRKLIGSLIVAVLLLAPATASAEWASAQGHSLLVNSDQILYPLLQIAVMGFAGWVAFNDWRARRRAGDGGTTFHVNRSLVSVNFFLATYAAATGVLVAITLAVDVTAQHRVLGALVDMLLVTYICLLNAWFRNKLLEWLNRLRSNVESW